MASQAPNLHTSVFRLPASGAPLVMPQRTDRTRLLLEYAQPRGQTDVRYWIGDDPTPDADPLNWPILLDRPYGAELGVQGPVYVASIGGTAVTIAVISSLKEAELVGAGFDLQLTSDTIVTGGVALISPEGRTIVKYTNTIL